jgi:hypothetical protein
LIDEFISTKILTDESITVKNITLQELIINPDFIKRVTKSFAFVKEIATLADSKTIMDSIDDCQDVFVTKDGDSSNPIIGWITNIIIEKNSRL